MVQSLQAPSVWLEFSPLATLTKAINLGQGFPGWQAPDFVLEAARVALSGNNQYARSAGSQHLCQTVSDIYRNRCQRELLWNENILVTVGASEAIYLALKSLLSPGDEAILFAPAFDIYGGAIDSLGGKAIYSPLTIGSHPKSANDFAIDYEAFRSSINLKTKVLILNTPHNPTGKVFSKYELEELAAFLQDFPHIKVISDEVYEHLIYDEVCHTSLASIPGMFDRTVTIYSAGKTFSVTGWKIGWAVGPKNLICPMQGAQQWVVFSVATPLQEAISESLKFAMKPFEGFSSYYSYLRNFYQGKRDLLYQGLDRLGLNPILPKGSFFITIKIGSDQIKLPENYDQLCFNGGLIWDHETHQLNDYNFCRQMSLRQRVTAIPLSSFQDPTQRIAYQNLVRFAFCKSDEDINEALRRLEK